MTIITKAQANEEGREGARRENGISPVAVLYLSLDHHRVLYTALSLPPTPLTAPTIRLFLYRSPSGLPSLSAFQRMTQQSEVAIASVPFPTATAKMDHDAEVEEAEAVRKGSRWSENIGGSPRSAGTSWS